MNQAKTLMIPLLTDCKLSSEMKPKTNQEKKEMSSVPYASLVGSLIYTMICSRPDMSHVSSVLSRFMAQPGRRHWEALKRVLAIYFKKLKTRITRV